MVIPAERGSCDEFLWAVDRTRLKPKRAALNHRCSVNVRPRKRYPNDTPGKCKKKTKFKLKNYENKQVHTFPKLMCSSGLLSEKAAQHRDSSRATHGDAVGDAWRRGRRIAC